VTHRLEVNCAPVLDAHAHPLAHNACKLDAATGLVVRAVEAIAAQQRMKEQR
jgi:hypothetical protein